MIDQSRSLLFTDLYQLTMLRGYHREHMYDVAVFEFFVRKLPAPRSFLMAAGLEQVLQYLEQAQFTQAELRWLADTQQFDESLLAELAGWRFLGDVHAVREGSIFFGNEPILRVSAPLPQAQLVESRLINLLHFQTLIASKAARCVLAAPAKSLVDFGLRRAHGAEAGLLAARAAYLAGFAGTATLAAGMAFGVPVYGTMAHSFVQAHDDETQAFAAFAAANPTAVVLLIDTYDTEAAAAKVVALAPQLRQRNIAVHGVRIDSGDLAEHARRVRRILDEGGLRNVTIFASGDIDEYRLMEHAASGVPIDGYGIGTRLDTSADAPYLDCAYKLQEYASRPRRKRSEGKATWPGPKQVYRRHDEQGVMIGDTIACENEICAGEALLQPVMRAGRRLGPPPSLVQSREHAARQLMSLPAPLRHLEGDATYPVTVSEGLCRLAAKFDADKGG